MDGWAVCSGGVEECPDGIDHGLGNGGRGLVCCIVCRSDLVSATSKSACLEGERGENGVYEDVSGSGSSSSGNKQGALPTRSSDFIQSLIPVLMDFVAWSISWLIPS